MGNNGKYAYHIRIRCRTDLTRNQAKKCQDSAQRIDGDLRETDRGVSPYVARHGTRRTDGSNRPLDECFLGVGSARGNIRFNRRENNPDRARQSAPKATPQTSGSEAAESSVIFLNVWLRLPDKRQEHV